MQEQNGRFFRRAAQHDVAFRDGALYVNGRRIVRRAHTEASDLNRGAMKREEQILSLLDRERYGDAILACLVSRSESEQPVRCVAKANFDPGQPRDDRGRWSGGGGGGEQQPVLDVQYRGYFHDVVVDDLLRSLEAGGSKVLKNVRVLGVNGVPAIPDGASRPKEWALPYFIEVKTGEDPPFTANQQQVYPLICTGGHATSFDPRIRQLGLVPGAPFPPLKIMLVYTRGPGLPFRFENYCDFFSSRGQM